MALQFVMVPLMAPGHIIPMIDMGKLFAQRGVHVAIVVTHADATRFGSAVDHSGLPIRLLKIRFPCEEAGLPPGCESTDLLPSYALIPNFTNAIYMLQKPLEEMLIKLSLNPNCIISDKNLPWTADISNKLQIPWIVFDGMSCFTQLVTHNLYVSNIHQTVPPNEPFLVPGLPDKIELTKRQLPGLLNPGKMDLTRFRVQVKETESQAYGVVINSFEEMEKLYVDEYRKVTGKKVWCIGPLSIGTRQASVDLDSDHPCLKWLGERELGSVVYACFGSLSRVSPAQFIELALGLEESRHPFLVVVKVGGAEASEIERWIAEDGIEERCRERGLFVRGWAPQVLILSHPAVGAFFTHCGWNSTLEGVCAGVPMITWPMFAEQFFNEKLLVQILEVGVGVGATIATHLGEEEKAEYMVMRDRIREAVWRVMDESEEACERRIRARQIGDTARRSVEEGGSSCLNITCLIQDIELLAAEKNKQMKRLLIEGSN